MERNTYCVKNAGCAGSNPAKGTPVWWNGRHTGFRYQSLMGPGPNPGTGISSIWWNWYTRWPQKPFLTDGGSNPSMLTRAYSNGTEAALRMPWHICLGVRLPSPVLT